MSDTIEYKIGQTAKKKKKEKVLKKKSGCQHPACLFKAYTQKIPYYGSTRKGAP